jgi:hypothetical protein
MKPFLSLLPLLVAGCATTGQGCHAPAFALNADRWHPGSVDLKPCSAARHGR